MIRNQNNFKNEILILSFPFLYFIFVYNQFIIQNHLVYKMAFTDFFITYLTLIITYSIIFFYFLKKKPLRLISFFKIFNLILIFLLVSNFYKYKVLSFTTKIGLDVFFIFILILISIFIRKSLSILLFFFTLLLLAKIIPNFLKTFNYLDRSDFKKINFIYKYEQNENKFNNVYHIILDGFQGNIYPQIELKNYFDQNKFIFYENFHSKYRNTEPSIKTTFNGFDHTFNEYKNIFFETEGWCKLLSEKKIFVEMYVINELNRRACSNNFITNIDIFKEFKNDKNIGENNYFDINQIYIESIYFTVFYNRLLPTSVIAILGKYISTDENSFFDPIMLMPAKFKKRLKITNINDPVTSFISYLKFFQNEIYIKDQNTYKHIHLMMPHAPFVFDRKTLKKAKNRNMPIFDSKDYFERYIDQSYFSLEIVKEFIEKLKENGKFEESMIIIHSDHGYNFVNIDGSFKKISSDNISYIESKTSSILLVKYPNSKVEKYDRTLNYQNEFVSKLILDNFEITNNINLKDQIIFFKDDKDLIIKNNLTGNWSE